MLLDALVKHSRWSHFSEKVFNNLQFSLQLQRCIERLVEHLRLKILRLLGFHYFRCWASTLHLRYLTGFWIRLWTLLRKRYWHRFFSFNFLWNILEQLYFSNIKAEKRYWKLTLRDIRLFFPVETLCILRTMG